MIVVGVVLLVLAALATLGVSLFNGGEVSGAAVFGVSLSNVSVGGLFVAGVVAGVIGALGLGLMIAGSARKRHKKQSTRRQVSSARTEAGTLAQENARLQQQLEAERTSTVLPVQAGSVVERPGDASPGR
ncbi:MAG: TRAP transporter large permease subunit [Frankiales bacterium]|nr:TRAP transporter large permease subunit [Frankiales bacterium]